MPSNGVWFVDRATGAATPHAPGDLSELLDRDDGWVWLDLPEPSEADRLLLSEVFGFHARIIDDAFGRNHVSRMHHYKDYVFLALHRPLRGDSGHVHYLEIDQFIGPNYLVTTHGPRNPTVPLAEMLVETGDVASRLESGRLRPRTPIALSYAITSALTNAEERIVNELAREVGQLEQRVMTQADEENPQSFLDELFTVRHALLTVRTMAAQSNEILSRATRLMAELPKSDLRLLNDLKDQYLRLDRITTSQLDFLQGVTDFYRARTDTRMTIAAERLAVIAAITLPVTAISSIMGMNVIVNSETHWAWLIVLLAVMGALSIWLLRWAHRQGWW